MLETRSQAADVEHLPLPRLREIRAERAVKFNEAYEDHGFRPYQQAKSLLRLI